jgi:hypothetical protein
VVLILVTHQRNDTLGIEVFIGLEPCSRRLSLRRRVRCIHAAGSDDIGAPYKSFVELIDTKGMLDLAIVIV